MNNQLCPFCKTEMSIKYGLTPSTFTGNTLNIINTEDFTEFTLKTQSCESCNFVAIFKHRKKLNE